MMFPQIRRFLQEEHATTSVEYAVMLALVLLAVFSAITAVGNSTSGTWSSNTSKLTRAMSGS